MNKPTPGPWLIDKRSGVIVIHRGPENTEACISGAESRAIARFDGQRTEDGAAWEMRPEQIGNAHLIVAAVNACFAVNPSNPMAVAEGMAELVEAAHKAKDHCFNSAWAGSDFVFNLLFAALAKLEDK